LERAAH
jgi:hypothetical protein